MYFLALKLAFLWLKKDVVLVEGGWDFSGDLVVLSKGFGEDQDVHVTDGHHC